MSKDTDQQLEIDFGKARHGQAGQGEAGLGWARPGEARQGKAHKTVVYLVQDERQRVKIGWTALVGGRLSGIQVGNADRLTLLATIPTEHPLQLERRIHSEWMHKHVRGEWFALTENDIQKIVNKYENTKLSGHISWREAVAVRPVCRRQQYIPPSRIQNVYGRERGLSDSRGESVQYDGGGKHQVGSQSILRQKMAGHCSRGQHVHQYSGCDNSAT